MESYVLWPALTVSRCVMTYRDDDDDVSRLDSLTILDVLLERCPSLVAGSAVRLLPNLIRLIAQPRQSSNTSRQKSATTTSLIVNPTSRLSTQKWRVHVMRRLAAFFDVVVSHSQQTNTSAVLTPVVTVTDTMATTHHCIQSSTQIRQSSLHQFQLRSLHLSLSVSDSFNSGLNSGLLISACQYLIVSTRVSSSQPVSI